MLSKKTKYALKALLMLAREPHDRPLHAADIAARERIPKRFLSTILLELTHHGIVGSRKGNGGGYFLGRRPGDIRVGTVVRVLEGPLAPIPCVSQTAYMKCDECASETACGVHLVMKDVRDSTARILDGVTLAQINDSLGTGGGAVRSPAGLSETSR
jgi:Rrf2 family protein